MGMLSRSAHPTVALNSVSFRGRLRPVQIALVAAGLVGALTAGGTWHWLRGERLPFHTWLAERSLGGVTRKAAVASVSEFAKLRLGEPLLFSVGGGLCRIEPKAIGLVLDVEGSVALARAGIARDRDGRRSLVPKFRFERAALEQALDHCEAEHLKARPVEAELRWEHRKLVTTEPRPGQAIARLGIEGRIGGALVAPLGTAITLSVVTRAPATSAAQLATALERAEQLTSASVVLRSETEKVTLRFSRQELGRLLKVTRQPGGALQIGLASSELLALMGTRRFVLERRPRDATFRVLADGKFEPVAEQDGRSVRPETLATAIESAALTPERRGELVFEPGQAPRLKQADVDPLKIHELLAAFSTHHACCQPRVQNIHRIADLLNGVIVLPGETFSVNERVGPRTTENGFVPAPSIGDGEFVETVGGGVSQFATTFYNAVLRAGFEILESKPHSYWFERYPMGHEATLSYPHPDLVFKNDSSAGLLIVTSYDERSITVRLYGDREGRQVTFGISGQFDVELPPLELLPNPTLDPEKSKTKEGGRIGWSVYATRTVVFADGKRRDDKRKVTYKAKVRRMEVHPCKIPRGELGYTGERCPKSEPGEHE